MPELPEVEIVKRSLFKMVNGAKIKKIKIYNNNLRYKLKRTFSKQLAGEKIIKITRRSKYLIFHFKKKILLAHLGMTGKFIVLRQKNNEIFKTSFYYDLNILKKHNHIYFILSNNLILIYNDVRRFGFLKIYNTKNLNKIKFIKKLGIEPLSKPFNVVYFVKKVVNKKKNIKNLLMDQTFISGLGNIYVNEALFLARINPLRKCKTINTSEIKKLIFSIKSILKFSIIKGGSSIKDFKSSSGKSGSFQQFFRVYGKLRENCARISCKGKVKKIYISNRSSFFCSKCQK